MLIDYKTLCKTDVIFKNKIGSLLKSRLYIFLKYKGRLLGAKAA